MFVYDVVVHRDPEKNLYFSYYYAFDALVKKGFVAYAGMTETMQDWEEVKSLGQKDARKTTKQENEYVFDVVDRAGHDEYLKLLALAKDTNLQGEYNRYLNPILPHNITSQGVDALKQMLKPEAGSWSKVIAQCRNYIIMESYLLKVAHKVWQN